MKKLILLAFVSLFLSNGLIEAGCKGGRCSRRPVIKQTAKVKVTKPTVLKSAAVKTTAKTHAKLNTKYIAVRNCKSGTCRRK